MPVRYANDCDGCRFLGRSGKFDLYLCVSAAPTVLVRFGNKGEQFHSCLVSRIYEMDPLADAKAELIEAARLAKEQGYLG